MPMTLSCFHSNPPTKFFSPKTSPRFHPSSNHSFSFSYSSLTANANHLKKLQSPHNFYGPFKKSFDGFPVKSSGFMVKAQNESGSGNNTDKEEIDARGQSTMPERFRYLAKEAPEKPVRWPWLIVEVFCKLCILEDHFAVTPKLQDRIYNIAFHLETNVLHSKSFTLFTAIMFVLYAWRAVLRELFHWRRSLVAVVGRFLGHISNLAVGFLGYISKLTLALIFHFIGDPVTFSIRVLEKTYYTIRALYSGVIAYAPIPELTTIIILTSSVLAISEAAVPDSVSSQPYVLTLAGLIGFAAVSNYISEQFFWMLLVGLFGFARFVKRRDYVSSVLPAAAVLAAVGEPWVRVVAMVSYLGLAIFQHSSRRVDLKEDEDGGVRRRVPFPLFCAALAIGVRVAAKWAGYRHLTWMVV
ncbi:hypothetical protein OROGR_015199 [Orobanche gracilis]